MEFKVIIQRGEEALYEPSIVDGASLTRAFEGIPSQLRFKVYKDDILDCREGDRVKAIYNGEECFHGFIFEKRRNSEPFIDITAYDQLRYLKNKDSFVFKDKTTSEVIKMLCDDYKLVVGDVADTKHKVEVHVSDNKTLIDLIYWYIYTTEIATQKLFELYDDNGKICLKDIGEMKLDYLLDVDVCEDYSYTSSIDKDTYNTVVLIENKKKEKDGKRQVFFKSDHENVKKWGILKYFERIDEKTDGNKKAEDILKLKNRVTRQFSVKNALGDIRVRGGSSVVCNMNIGDIELSNYMLVRKVTHKFNNMEHTMDLVLSGRDIDV